MCVGEEVGGRRWEGLKTKALPEKDTPSGQLVSDAISPMGEKKGWPKLRSVM